MAFERQRTGDKFVAWGKDKAKDNSLVVDEGKYLEGKILEIKPNSKFGVIFKVYPKTPKSDEPVLITGTTILNREMGYATKKDKEGNQIILEEGEQQATRVVVGDVVRIHFDGYLNSKKGNKPYNLWVEVDRDG